MASINPYLTFGGKARRPFPSTRRSFGGEFMDFQRFSGAPPDTPGAESDADRVMHVSLPIGDDQVLMGSDRPSMMGPTTLGDSVSVSIGPDSSDEGKRIFESLSAGGRVIMPYESQFWGADYGMVTDKFGIHWMVNYNHPE